jgi:TolB-like protein/DNA-binding winged helix-turn-helix (wHTH) protein/Flp pilus assembly protein TadD
MESKPAAVAGPDSGAGMQSEFQIAEWIVSPKLNSFRKNGQVIHLEPKVMQVLVCLAEERDVVSKEKLMRRVWPDTFVTDDVLTRSISELRKVFADNPKDPKYIQTIPKGGYRLIAPVLSVQAAAMPPTAPPPAPDVQKPARNPLPLFVAVVAALLLIAYSVGRYNARYNASASAHSGRVMLAVLPFQNLSNDPDQQYFADGLTAEMISQFGHLPSDRLGVIDWNSMARYRGSHKDEAEIGKELGANYLLEGTVRRSGNHVRITAELLETGLRNHLWSNSYDGNLEDVLKLQNQVAREIAGEIRVQLSAQDQIRLANSAPVNGEGYDDYLKARLDSRNASADMLQTIDQLRQATRLNPNYAPPYVVTAMMYRNLASTGFADPRASYAGGRLAIEKALEIDPTSAEAHRELAWIEWRSNWDFAAADREFHKAVELDPNDSQTHATYTLYLKSVGRNEEALNEVRKALELDPLGSFTHTNAGSQLALMHNFPAAEREFERAAEIDPHQPYVYERMGPTYLLEGKNTEAIAALEKARDYSGGQQDKLAWLGYAYAKSGRKEDAINVLAQLRHLAAQGQYVSPLHVALVCNGLGDKEQAIAWLEKAYRARDEYLVYLRVYPEFQNLHSDPRFQALEQRMSF